MKTSHVCPKCKKTYEGHGALSREDNRTIICPRCGTSEALAGLAAYLKEHEKDIKE